MKYPIQENKVDKLIQKVLAFTLFIILPSISQYIWPRYIKYPTLFRVLSGPIVHLISFTLNNLIIGFLYYIKHPKVEQYKCNNEPWPWEENTKEWMTLFRKTLLLVGFFNLVLVPLTSLLVNSDDHRKPRLDYASLPSIPEFICHFIICVLANDTVFYWSHRLLHSKYMYKYIHKVHHEHKITVGFASEYTHPLEFIIGNLLPNASGPMLLGSRLHGYTHLCWIFVRIIKATEAHCGYNFPWSLNNLFPMSIESDFHNYHHLSFKDNYGSFTKLWDYLCRTIAKDYQSKLKECDHTKHN
jgi:sterol desaturase/sphingolipid hydroxylase (fatty acid hydroxylase superfamily)